MERANKSYQNIKKTNRSILENSIKPLNMSTYDGSGQVVHPCVIDFKNEFNMDSWGGYRYWLVITPYPNSDDSMENPCLYASHDGENWIVPDKLCNPLDAAPGGWEKGFNNDPDMIYNPDDNTLWIYYRFANNNSLEVKLIKIYDDMKYDKPETIIRQSPWNQTDNKSRSLCICRESADKWHMWGAGGSKQPPYNIYYFHSNNGIDWSEPTQCFNKNYKDVFGKFGYYNWHMSCKPNYKEKRIEFLCYCQEKKGIRQKISSRLNKFLLGRMIASNNPILYAECRIDSPTIFSTPLKKPILLPSKDGWDNESLYRASFQIMNEGKRYYYKVWYTARSKDGIWGLGYTAGYLGTERDKLS